MRNAYSPIGALLLALIALYTAVSSTASAAEVACPSVQLTLLNTQWSSLPTYNGSPATLDLTFYSACTYYAVTFTAEPMCPYLAAGQPTFLQSIPANGIFTVPLQLYAKALNVTCPIEVLVSAQYGAGYSSLSTPTATYVATVYVPPYPTFSASISGSAYLGVPSLVYLAVEDPYGFPAQVSISGQSLAVLSPLAPVQINKTAEIPVLVLPYSTAASLQISITSHDYLGSPVAANYAVAVPVLQSPPPNITLSPATLYLGVVNNVTIAVEAPFKANGTAVVAVSGASLSSSPIIIPIRDGRGAASVSLTPLQSPVVFQATIYYSVAGYQTSVQASATAQAVQPTSALASLLIRPTTLIANAANNITIEITAPGPFSASLDISGASTAAPMPIYISGVNEANYSLVLYPTSSQVVITAQIETDKGSQQYTAYLPVISSNLFLVSPSPTMVLAGGNRTILVKLVNQGNIPVESGVVVIAPAAGSSLLLGTVVYNFSSLQPLSYVEFPLSFVVPAGTTGPLAFQYTVYYLTPLGSGEAQGTFYVQAYQPPSILVTSASATPTAPTTSSPFFISVTVVNNGFVPVNNLQMELEAPRELMSLTPTLSYIGQLSTQQSQTATFSLEAFSPGRYTIPIVITYQDQYGNTYNNTVTVTVFVRGNSTGFGNFTRFPRSGNFTSFPSRSGSSSNGLAYGVVAAIVVVAAALIALGIWRRRR
ncbi:MAG: hypothetical protein TU35_004330 [Thermoproteus sp. AZ2]|jgi:hypothetical protein|uniref:Uncharacterized protein n=1 Tax=Thermoproteus sp. AZ2 TaxID=1609232 RepID=A0ACC6V0E9_9CREN